MMAVISYGAWFVLLNAILQVLGNLDHALHHYDTLKPSDIKHDRTQRSTGKVPGCEHRQITFKALGKLFKLHLTCQKGLFSSGFQVIAVDSKNVTTNVPVETSEFLEGYVIGARYSSKVYACWEDDDLLATVKFRDETYVIEPSWRHLEKSEHFSMIVYRVSDMKFAPEGQDTGHMGNNFCGYVHPDHDDAAYSTPRKEVIINDEDMNTVHKSNRVKRQTTSGDSCSLMLVADYRFYRTIGRSDRTITMKYLAETITWVDSIYRAEKWGSGQINLGFEIKGVIIHTAPTSVTKGQVHYNMERTSWGTSELLKAFSNNNQWVNYCLAHLFTSTAFSDGVLGLAWIASPKHNAAGGVCSPYGGGNYYNTAWSSTLNKYGNRLLTQEARIVTTHEFGHNWGSPHDPSSAECAPGSKNSGNYLMYTYAVSGYDANNRKFSPCSRRSVLSVLDSKRGGCFTVKQTSICGDLLVDGNEMCDAGAAGSLGNDPCCTRDCKLKSGAVCSDMNSACCTGCQYASATTVCQAADTSNTTCDGAATCTGTGPDCPAANYKPDNSSCLENGRCQSGVCMAFCESEGLISCICQQEALACKWCCKNGINGQCIPYNSLSMDLPDGKPCTKGMCEQGTCKKSTTQLTQRLWNVIETININFIVQFMKNNIVLAVIVFSLVIYVPACIVVCCIDWRREKQDKKDREWHSSRNNHLVRRQDGGKVFTAGNRRPLSRSQAYHRDSSVTTSYASPM